jgi:hypothetical protein
MAQRQPSLLGVGWPERTGIWRTEVIARIPLFQKYLSTPTLGGPAADPSGQFLKKAFQIRAALDDASRAWACSLPLTRSRNGAPPQAKPRSYGETMFMIHDRLHAGGVRDSATLIYFL